MIKFTDIQISYGDFVAVDNLNLEILGPFRLWQVNDLARPGGL